MAPRYQPNCKICGAPRDPAANVATLAGWRVLYFSTDDLEDDPEGAISQLRAVLERSA